MYACMPYNAIPSLLFCVIYSNSPDWQKPQAGL
jgi:hypothetical protein